MRAAPVNSPRLHFQLAATWLSISRRHNSLMVIQWIQEALALHQAGRLAEAESLYLKALTADKDFYPALHLMGLVRLHQGRAAEALPYIERALSLKPDTPETLCNY